MKKIWRAKVAVIQNVEFYRVAPSRVNVYKKLVIFLGQSVPKTDKKECTKNKNLYQVELTYPKNW